MKQEYFENFKLTITLHRCQGDGHLQRATAQRRVHREAILSLYD